MEVQQQLLNTHKIHIKKWWCDMKRFSMFAFLFVCFVVVCTMLVSYTMVSPDSAPTNPLPILKTSMEQTHFASDIGIPEENDLPVSVWNVDVDEGQNLERTSDPVGSDTYISSCIVYDSGDSGDSAYIVYVEIPTSGSPVVKWNRLVTAPWDGCAYHYPDPNPPAFTVGYNSKVKLSVTSNTGVAHQHQVNSE